MGAIVLWACFHMRSHRKRAEALIYAKSETPDKKSDPRHIAGPESRCMDIASNHADALALIDKAVSNDNFKR